MLNFSVEVLIVKKVDQLRLQQTEMQAKICAFIEKLDLDHLDRFVESDISGMVKTRVFYTDYFTCRADADSVKEMAALLRTTESKLISELRFSKNHLLYSTL